MKDQNRSKEELIQELHDLRNQLAELQVQQAHLLRIQQKAKQAAPSSQSLEEIAREALSDLAQSLHCDRVSVLLFDHKAHELSILANYSAEETDFGVGTRSSLALLGNGLGGLAGGKVIVQENLSALGARSPMDQFYLSEGIQSYAWFPLIVRDELLGSLNLSRREPGPFSKKDRRTATETAVSLAIAIGENRLAEAEQLRSNRLYVLLDVVKTINTNRDVQECLDVLIDAVIEQLQVDAAEVLLYNPKTRLLEHAQGRGFLTQTASQARLHLGEGIAGQAAQLGIWQFVFDLTQVGPGFVWTRLLREENFLAYLAVPLIAKGQIKGVLNVFNRSPIDPDPEWLDFLRTLTNLAANAIDNANLFAGLEKANKDLARANEELIQAYDDTIMGWSKAADLRDSETEKHLHRVVQGTVSLARRIGVPEDDIVHIKRGAFLHDIGKLGVPDNILTKRGPLTDEEWVQMRKHPVYAYEILSAIPYLRPALDIPHYHHEKWDGSGYPCGLKEEEIPLIARIFAVIDVWDALTSDRCYRKAWLPEKALDYITQQSGSHFDPAIIPEFIKLLDSVP